MHYRISGPDVPVLRDKARGLAATVASDPRLNSIVMNWNAPGRVIRIDILQDKARQLGLTSKDIAGALDTIYSGQTVTQLRDSTYLVNIVVRGDKASRSSIEALNGLQLSGSGGDAIPLSSVAVFHYASEPPVI